MSTTTGGTKSKILDTKIGDDVGAQILWVYRSRSRGISHQDEECFYNHCTQQLRHVLIISQVRSTKSVKKNLKNLKDKSLHWRRKNGNTDQTKECEANEVRFGGERNPASDCVSNGGGL